MLNNVIKCLTMIRVLPSFRDFVSFLLFSYYITSSEIAAEQQEMVRSGMLILHASHWRKQPEYLKVVIWQTDIPQSIQRFRTFRSSNNKFVALFRSICCPPPPSLSSLPGPLCPPPPCVSDIMFSALWHCVMFFSYRRIWSWRPNIRRVLLRKVSSTLKNSIPTSPRRSTRSKISPQN